MPSNGNAGGFEEGWERPGIPPPPAPPLPSGGLGLHAAAHQVGPTTNVVATIKVNPSPESANASKVIIHTQSSINDCFSRARQVDEVLRILLKRPYINNINDININNINDSRSICVMHVIRQFPSPA